MRRIVKNIKNILWLCKPYWKYGKLYIFLSIIVLIIPSPIGDYIYINFPNVVLNSLYDKKSFFYITTLTAIICIVSLINKVFPNLFYSYFTKKQTEIDLKMNRNIYIKAIHIDYKYIDEPEYYDSYAWAINEYRNQTNEAREFVIRFFQYFFSMILLISVITRVGPWILLIELLQMSIHAIINIQVNKNDIKMKDELVSIDRRLNYYHRLFYIKDYAADMRSTKLSKYIIDAYDETGKSKKNVSVNFAKKTAFWGCMHEVVFVMTEFIIILYLVHNIVNGNISQIGLYMTMILAFYRLDSKLYGFINMFKKANVLSLNAEKIRQFFNIKENIEVENSNAAEITTEKNFSVELQHVNFSYTNSDFSIKNLDFTIKPGEKIAIVGENGSGKTTLVKLLMRLYDVSQGTILINGKPISQYNVEDLRNKIGVAFQNSNIYAMSFKKNVALYGEISEDLLNNSEDKFELDSIMKKNNADYNSELTREFDNCGIILSGGEIQKIALARVMSRDFGMLLLDEPSSALDPIAESKMVEMILSAANKTTTIMVTHRLSTIRTADKIFLFDQGTIIESGTHDQLMALNGKYYEMFTKQAENYLT